MVSKPVHYSAVGLVPTRDRALDRHSEDKEVDKRVRLSADGEPPRIYAALYDLQHLHRSSAAGVLQNGTVLLGDE